MCFNGSGVVTVAGGRTVVTRGEAFSERAVLYGDGVVVVMT